MTKIIKLADIATPPKLRIEVDGETHDLKISSVQDFVDNLADLDRLSGEFTMREEMEVAIEIILRGFPTISREKMMSWPVTYIRSLSEIARGVNGEIVTDDAEEAALGNDQKAD